MLYLSEYFAPLPRFSEYFLPFAAVIGILFAPLPRLCALTANVAQISLFRVVICVRVFFDSAAGILYFRVVICVRIVM